MTDVERKPNAKIRSEATDAGLIIGALELVRHSSFVIRISCAAFFTGLVCQVHAAPFPISAATNAINNPFPVVGTDGSNYLVGLQFIRSNQTSEPVFQLVSATGTLLGPPIKSGRTGDPPRAIAFGGANYLVSWADYSSSSNGSVP